MITISLCMIVKDEEKTLPFCLNSVKGLVDEIIIVDTGSTDNTKKVARRYTDKIFDFKWQDDFSMARNFSFSKASKDFIMWLDADDILMERDRLEFKNLKEILTLEFDAVIMKYILQRDKEGQETYFCYRERLVKRENNYRWQDQIHEHLDFGGKVVQAETAITHTKTEYSSDRNLKILRKIVSNTTELTPRFAFYYARESEAAGNLDDAIKYYNLLLNMENNEQTPYVEGCIHLAGIYHSKNEKKRALQTLIRSFEFGPLRAEVLCYIGKHFIELKEYNTAISWYNLALSLDRPKKSWLFMMPEYWGVIPYIELCHCYFHTKNFVKAIECHKLAQKIKPYHPAVIENEKFFSSILQ